MAYTVQDILWVCTILAMLGLIIRHQVRLHFDNESASRMTANLIQRDQSKHIAIDYHFVRERLFMMIELFVMSSITKQ